MHLIICFVSREKMAFFTCIKSTVPILGQDVTGHEEEDEEEEDDEFPVVACSTNPSPLSFTTPTPSASANATPLPPRGGGCEPAADAAAAATTTTDGLRPGFSTETVDTLTEDDLLARERGINSQNSTPTPNRQVERFVYEVDPELGAFV